MKLKKAAVLEPKDARWKELCAGLKRAGLKVSAARTLEELGREQLVVLGPGLTSHARAAQKARQALPGARVLSAQTKGFRAAWADGALPLPVSPNDLKARLADWENSESHAGPRPGEGIVDPRTNFYTFSHFKDVLFIEVKRARRYGFPLALALIAFDPESVQGGQKFKEQLMSGLAIAIRRSLRDTDYPVQQAADRVLVLMPHTDLAGSLIVARRICERVARATLQAGDAVLSPTISVGVAAGARGREYGFADLVRCAQEGLALALSHGGNRVEFFEEAAETSVAEGKALRSPNAPPAIPPLPPSR
jgi:diguanylate cyclase (GGDEF)-like protein